MHRTCRVEGLQIQMLVFLVVVSWCLITDGAFEGIPGNREMLHSLSIIWYLYSFWCFFLVLFSTNSTCPILSASQLVAHFPKTKKYGAVAVNTLLLPLLLVVLLELPILILLLLNVKHKDLLKVRLIPLVNIITSSCSSRRVQLCLAHPSKHISSQVIIARIITGKLLKCNF